MFLHILRNMIRKGGSSVKQALSKIDKWTVIKYGPPYAIALASIMTAVIPHPTNKDSDWYKIRKFIDLIALNTGHQVILDPCENTEK